MNELINIKIKKKYKNLMMRKILYGKRKKI